VYSNFDNVSISVSAISKRYKMITLHGTLELLIYKWFLLSEIFKVVKFNSLLVVANWRNKAGKSKVRRDVITQIRLLRRCSFIGYENLRVGLVNETVKVMMVSDLFLIFVKTG